MKALLLAALFALASVAAAQAEGDPCANYYYALAYSRTKDATPVTLTLSEPKTGAAIEMRLPRNFMAIRGNLTDGPQCKIAFELMWPQLTAGGLVDDHERRVRDRMIGDMPAWRSLTIDVHVNRQAWAHWMVPGRYCGERTKLGELSDRPFGLRALNDRIAWPKHRQADGSYRNMQELLPYPRNSANIFYFIHDDPNEIIRIHCSKGAPRCQLEDHFQGLRTTTVFDGDDIANWQVYRDAVRRFLAAHTVRSTPPRVPADHGLHVNPSAERAACMWEMEPSIGAETLRRMGFSRPAPPR